MERKADGDYAKACTRLLVEGKTPVVRPRKTWQNMRLMKVDQGMY